MGGGYQDSFTNSGGGKGGKDTFVVGRIWSNTCSKLKIFMFYNFCNSYYKQESRILKNTFIIHDLHIFYISGVFFKGKNRMKR